MIKAEKGQRGYAYTREDKVGGWLSLIQGGTFFSFFLFFFKVKQITSQPQATIVEITQKILLSFL